MKNFTILDKENNTTKVVVHTFNYFKEYIIDDYIFDACFSSFMTWTDDQRIQFLENNTKINQQAITL